MLTRACQYGILLTIHLATSGDDRFEPVHAAADRLGLSSHFLAKIVRPLTASGLLRSYRGPNGGVALAIAPQSIRIRDIVAAIDGMRAFERCVLGLPGCGHGRHCPLHESWSAVRADLVRLLDETTVGMLAERIDREDLRLSALDSALPDLITPPSR